jgi:protein-tyrosine phosphatase
MSTSTDDPIRVDFVSQTAHGLPGRLGLTIAPGKCDDKWKRDLAADLRRLRDYYHADVLVSLLEPHEYQALGIASLAEAAQEAGISVLRLAIQDVSVPASMEGCQATVAKVIGALADEKTVVVHCRGGLGRSGLVAACCLVACGDEPGVAISSVRQARPGAVETMAQERFVARFAKEWNELRDDREAEDGGQSAPVPHRRGPRAFRE